jgi:hypothetical protein
MSQPGTSRWLAIAVIAVACLLLTSATAWAQAQPTDVFWVNYFSNNVPGNSGGLDQEVRIVNPGAYAPSYPPASLCAMIYVFDNMQEMKECCGCLISTNGLAELSVANDLTSNTFNGVAPTDGDIKIVSAVSNYTVNGAPACDPTGGGISSTGGYVLNIAPTADLRSWGTHLPGYRKADGHITEDEFQDATLSTGELDSLQEECTGVIAVGSGYGQCGQHASNSSFSCTL